MITVFTVIYLACFISCAIPGIVRVVQRKSSADLSIWREVLLLVGVATQFTVMLATGADWRVWISPVLSGLSVSLLLVVTLRYR